MYVGAAIGLIGLLALVGGGLFFWVASSKIDDDGGAVTARSTPDRTAPAEGSVGADAPLPITADDPSWGSDTAPVTAVVFSDYDCPYCKKLEATVANLKTRYGPHKLRVVFKHFPLPSHTRARDAHIASQAVRAVEGNDAFWRFHERAFEEMGGGTGAVDLAGWAESAGLSRSDFDAARGDTRHGAKVDADIALGKRLGVNGIPATFINGISLRGAQPESKLAETIDAQLSAAETELAAGTPATQIYTTLTARNLAPAADKPAPTPAPSPPAADDTTVWKVPVLPTDPVLGPADAAVTLVAFSDFECPFCSRAANTVREIHQAYPSEVRIVWKDHALPFHKNAPAAHQLAREAQAQLGNDGFWKAHDLLFENQRALSRDQLLGYAGQLGLDRAKVADALAKNAHQGHLDTGATLAADVEASGTPHFFVNGRRIKGAVPFEKFKTVIDEEIAHAARLRAEGVSAGNLYAEIIKSGKGGPELERKEAGALGPDTPMKGAPNAPVTIHVFSDFQCPFCGRVNPTLAELLTQYDGRVRVAWRHFPLAFHKDAPLAHQAAQEAKSQRGDAGFWAMHDKLFANQKELDRVSLERYAAEIGLDVGAFRAALDSQKHRARVEAEVAAGQAAGIRGTPSFVINGYFISGAQPAAKFRSIIDRALAEAGGSSL